MAWQSIGNMLLYRPVLSIWSGWVDVSSKYNEDTADSDNNDNNNKNKWLGQCWLLGDTDDIISMS